MLKKALFSLLIAASPALSDVSNYLNASCPALMPDGTRIPLVGGPKVEATDPETEDNQPALAFVSDPALKLVGLFEAGGGDPYANISYLDTISIGYLQWNWGKHSLVDTLLKETSIEDIHLAAEPLKSQLLTLKKYEKADEEVTHSASDAKQVIAAWINPSNEDLRNQIRAWLTTPNMRRVQNGLMESKLKVASAFARKWSEESDSPLSEEDLIRVGVATFDQLVYNGGRGGLWRDHAVSLRKEFNSNKDVIDFVYSWVGQCVSYVHSFDTPDRQLYNTGEIFDNVTEWKEAISANADAFTDLQIELLLYAYIRATRSIGDNDPQGFPGIFQADVFLRAATPVMGMGTGRGRDIETFFN